MGVRLSNIKRNANGRMIHADIAFEPDKGLRASMEGMLHTAQMVVDSETVRYLQAYVPLKTGMLQKSIALNTQLGSGEVEVGTPYGHYQNFLDMPYKTIEPGDPRYSNDPLRGSHFAERVLTDHGDDIIAAAQKAIGG